MTTTTSKRSDQTAAASAPTRDGSGEPDAPASPQGSPAADRDAVRSSPGSGPEDRQPDRDASRSAGRQTTDRPSKGKGSGGRSRSDKRGGRQSDERKGGRRNGPRPSETTRQSYRRPLTKALGTVGLAISTVDPFTGTVVMARADDTARMLDEAAQTNPAIARTIESLTTGGSGFGAVGLALAPIVGPILWRFGLVPDGQVTRGMVPAEAIAAGQAQGVIGPDGAPRKRADQDRPKRRQPTDEERERAAATVADLGDRAAAQAAERARRQPGRTTTAADGAGA